MKVLSICFILISFLFALSGGASEKLCLYSAKLESVAEHSCQTHRKTCEERFSQEGSDLYPYLKKCPSEESTFSVSDHATLCMSLVADPLIDTTMSMAYSAQKRAQENLVSTNRLVQECLQNKDTRQFMIQMVPMLKPYQEMEVDVGSCSLIVTEFQAWALNYLDNKSTASLYRNKKMKPLQTPMDREQTDNIVSSVWDQHAEKFSCLNNYGKTYLSCYYFFSVVDPTLLLGIGLKAPQLAKLFNLKAATVATRAQSPIAEAVTVRKLGRHYKAMLGNFWDVGSLKTSLLGRGTHLRVDLIRVDAAFRQKGISEKLLREAVEANPRINRISGLLVMTNKEQYLKAIQSGLEPAEAFRQTPLGRVAVKLGFTKVEFQPGKMDVEFVKP